MNTGADQMWGSSDRYHAGTNASEREPGPGVERTEIRR